MREDKAKIPIVSGVMKVDTNEQAIDMQKIRNRRFMYDPKTATLVLGRQYPWNKQLISSHAVELAEAGITEGYDDFVRGWVGAGKGYPHGVIHFAPHVSGANILLFERAFDTLQMFSGNGAEGGTLIRGFGSAWEQPLSSILSPGRDAEQRPSMLKELKEKGAQIKVQKPQTAAPQQER